MLHFFHYVVRPAGALLGAFLLSTGILLYPAEDGTIQSKLEDFWVRLDDYQSIALSRHAAFMRQVARLETNFLNRIFGHSLFSLQSIGVSSFFSFGSLIASVVLLQFTIRGHRFSVWDGIVVMLLPFGVTLVLAGAKYLPKPLKFIAVLVSLSTFLAIDRHWEGRFGPPFLLFLSLCVGIIFDIFFIATTRLLLGLASELKYVRHIALILTLNFATACILISPYVVFRHLSGSWDFYYHGWANNGYRWLLVIVPMTNVLDLVLALTFFALSLLLLFHRFSWPLLNRTIFRMIDIGIKGRRAILTSLGTALLGSSVFGNKFPDLLKSLVKALGG